MSLNSPYALYSTPAQKEGAIAYKLWKEVQEKREEKQQEIIERKPAPYKHIKVW